MASWDHRAATGNGAYQLYLYVVENSVVGDGNGITNLSWELGYIKVGSSGGFGSSNGSVPWEVHMQGNNNGDVSGTGAYNFGAGDAIGTRRAIAVVNGWTFSHNPSGDGGLTLNTMARAVSNGTSFGTSQIGWGAVGMTPASRIAAAPPAPQLLSRDSDSQVTIRAFNSYDWGVGGIGVLHYLDQSLVSDFSSLTNTAYPTTGGGVGHSVVQGSLDSYKTYYYRDATRGRDGQWVHSGTLTVFSRPSPAPAPSVASKTATTVNLSTSNPSYTGAGITARETQLVGASDTTVIATSTHLTTPSFSGMTRATGYRVRTRVQNSTGWSDWSGYTAFNTAGSPPSAPTGYSVTSIAATSCSVTTGAIADNGGAVPTKIRVKVSTTASDAGLVKTVTQDTWAPVSVTGLVEDTTYYVAEAAYNAVEGGGWGPYGGWVSFHTINTVPNAPVMTIGTITDNTALASWAAPTNLNGAVVSGYTIKVSKDQAQTQGVLTFTAAAGATSKSLIGLDSGTQYYATIYADTDKGPSSISAPVPFQTTGFAPSGIYYTDGAGVTKYSEVWYSGADGIPKLCEVWYSGADGIPKLCQA